EEEEEEIEDPDEVPPSSPTKLPPIRPFSKFSGKKLQVERKPVASTSTGRRELAFESPPTITPLQLSSSPTISRPTSTLHSKTKSKSLLVTTLSDGRGPLDGENRRGCWKPDERCSVAQLEAIEAVRRGENVFLTGPAGTGKSFLLHQIRSYLAHEGKRFQITATTGIASINVNGPTIFSFAGIGIGDKPVEALRGRVLGTKAKLEGWKKTDVLVVDEISMLGPDIFTKLSMVGKLVRERKEPFGGIQIVVCGDFFQLPPVPDSDPTCIRCGKKAFTTMSEENTTLPFEAPLLSTKLSRIKKCNNCALQTRERTFAFETEAWAECAFRTIELTKVFRQENPALIDTLANFRRGICTVVDEKLIKSGGGLVRDSSVGTLNMSTKLYPHRKSVEDENKREFDKIKEPALEFTTLDSCAGKKGAEHLKEALSKGGRLDNFRAPPIVSLKIGSAVMLLVNLDPEAKLANGSTGKIIGWLEERVERIDWTGAQFGGMDWAAMEAERWLEEQKDGEEGGKRLPVVQFDCGVTRTIGAHSWCLEIDPENWISRTQIPLQLAWALTIHKSQGQTLQRVRVHLNNTFAPGQ
ncbi:ATP-dependent DNA helicase PIF1, partial [Phenoliferia sp. Uapishka_3]